MFSKTIMISYISPQTYTSRSDHGLLCGVSRKTSFQCLLCTVLRLIYVATKSLGLVYMRKFRSSAKIRRKVIGVVWDFLIYVYVSNEFLTRKGSAILHGKNFVFLTEWFSATSSHDVTVMSMRFFDVGASENVIF